MVETEGVLGKGVTRPATCGLPLSRFTRTELHRLVIERGVTDASATTIWRWLHDAAIKP